MTGFFKKLKDTAEKSLEKGKELGAKGLDAAKESAKKGYDRARDEKNFDENNFEPIQEEKIKPQETMAPNSSTEPPHTQNPSPSSDQALKTLKLRYAKGEISKEDYEEMKKMIE